MPVVALTGGAYEARSVIASAQRALNLYAEPMPQAEGEPAPMAHYPTPGLRLLSTLPHGPVRGIRQCSNGGVYCVAGDVVYRLGDNWVGSALGTISQGGVGPVSMAENTLDLVICDGLGWSVHLASDAFSQITATNFNGATAVDYLDTYLLFGANGTPQFQSSNSLALTFDPLWFANVSAAPDQLIALAAVNSDVWLLGERHTEVWYDVGSADFPFQRQSGVFIDHGTAARSSVTVLDNAVYWLSRDRRGQGVVLRSKGYGAERVSTYAIETEISSYDIIADAVGMSYALNGHMFYLLSFPSADKTWMYDATTGLWSELCWIDSNGAEHAHRANCMFACRDLIVCGDRQSGAIYALDPGTYTDNGTPIKRQRAWPHQIAGLNRVTYQKFLLDVACGQAADQALDPQIFLDWSDDRGRSFGNPLAQSLGKTGRYLTSVQWQRLGMARDRVFRITTSAPVEFALQGATIAAQPAIS